MIDAGGSLLVIEHNLDVIKTADYIIDLGPEGGDAGGHVVGIGTPEEIMNVPESYTGRFLRDYLAKSNGHSQIKFLFAGASSTSELSTSSFCCSYCRLN